MNPEELTYLNHYKKILLSHVDQALKLTAQIKTICQQKKLTVATAESCTSGLLASLLSEFPGSSTFYLGGANVYSNDAKISMCEVDSKLLIAHGAVSKEVAESLCMGIAGILKAHFAVSLTGIAGPGGATETKPIGTVWCGLKTPEKTVSELFQLSGERYDIRWQSSIKALDLLSRAIAEY